MVTTRKRIALRCSIAVVASLTCAILPAVLRAEADDAVVETFKVSRYGGGLVIPVWIGEERYDFMIDTGATANVFDSSLREKLVPTDEVDFVIDANEEHRLYTSPAARVGESRMPVRGRAVCVDLARFRAAARDEQRGILGMSFLADKIVVVDQDEGSVSFLRRLKAPRGRRVELGTSHECPTVTARLPHFGNLPFLVDTGFLQGTDGQLSAEIADALVRRNEFILYGRRTRTIGVSGSTLCRQGTLGKFSVSDHSHEGLTFVESDENIIGLGYLSRYVVTFDFPSRAMYLEPGKRFRRSFGFENRAGMLLHRVGDAVEAARVAPGGAAHRAGIRNGDRIIAINGLDPRSLNANERGALLYSEPHELTITIQRDGEPSAVEIPLGGARAPRDLRSPGP